MVAREAGAEPQPTSGPPVRVLMPPLHRSVDQGYETERRRLRREAWAKWRQHVEAVPRARALLEEIDRRVLAEAEELVAQADRRLEEAKAAALVRKIRAEGNVLMGILDGAELRAVVTFDESELLADPDYLTARTHRLRMIQARAKVWAWRATAAEIIGIAEHARPPGPEE